MKCVSQPRGFQTQQSAFFPNAPRTDDSQEKLSISQPHAGNNRVVVEPFKFPVTSNVLWNRKSQGEPEFLHLVSKRNLRILVNEQTLRLAVRHLNQATSPFDCFLIGSISVDTTEEGLDLNIDRFDPGREILENNGKNGVRRKVPTTVVPGDQIVPIKFIRGLSGAENSITHAKEEFSRALTILHSRVSGQDPLSLSSFLSLKACCHTHSDDEEVILNLHFGAITMVTSILATPVAAVPIIPTALARNLSGPLRLSEVQGAPKCGFLTMDHTRKLLLILESDPKAYSLPLIGIWVSGSFTVHHPYVWACCIKFLSCSSIQERVLVAPSTFLLVHYSPAHTHPIFWECSPQEQLTKTEPFELYSCYENLHLEVSFDVKFSEPLCFDLLPCGDNMNRSLFEQAVSVWNSKQSSTRDAVPGIQSKVDAQEGAMLVPRPSPSPHPQLRQNPMLAPTVPEVSLSLSFEEPLPQDGEQLNRPFQAQSGNLQNGRFLIEQKNQARNSRADGNRDRRMRNQNQENRILPNDPRKPGKQVLNGLPQNSPKRQPLRSVDQNQTLGAVIHSLPNPVMPKATEQNVCLPSNGLGYGNGLQENGCGLKRPTARCGPGARGRGRGRGNPARKMQRNTLPGEVQHQKYANSGTDQSLDNQESPSVSHHNTQGTGSKQDLQHPSLPGSAQAFDSQSREQSLQHLSKNNAQAQDSGGVEDFYLKPSQAKGSTDQGIPLGGDRKIDSTKQSPNDTRFQDSGVGDSSIDWTRNGDSPNEKGDSLGSMKGDSCGSEDPPTVRRLSPASQGHAHPDPYELLMRQEQQLKELQKQMKLLLLQQQNTPQPSLPSVLPHSPAPSTRSETSNLATACAGMVTMATNTGSSLMLHSPVSVKGKKSAATSPIVTSRNSRQTNRTKRRSTRDSDVNQREITNRANSSRISSRSSSDSSSTSSPSEHGDHKMGVLSPGTLALNADEALPRRDLVADDDPNQTLASSVHAVDLHSYIGSPEASSKRMNSFCSPVLGESASFVREDGEKSSNESSHTRPETKVPRDSHDITLQENEKLFYDNLLAKARELLCKDIDDKHEAGDTTPNTSQPSISLERSVPAAHVPTKQEVVMATLKELERIKNGGQKTFQDPPLVRATITDIRASLDRPH